MIHLEPHIIVPKAVAYLHELLGFPAAACHNLYQVDYHKVTFKMSPDAHIRVNRILARKFGRASINVDRTNQEHHTERSQTRDWHLGQDRYVQVRMNWVSVESNPHIRILHTYVSLIDRRM